MIVLTYNKCPQCGGVYTTEFNILTREKDTFCQRCGKSVYYPIVKNNDGEPVLDEDGEPKYLEEANDGYGIVRVATNDDMFTYCRINKPLNLEEAKANCFEILGDPFVDKSRSYFTYWEAEKKDIVVLSGYDPGTYEDFIDTEDIIPF